MGPLKLEPTLVLYALNAGWSAAQLVAIPMPTWAHAVVLGVSGALSALVNRAAVTPNAKLEAPRGAPDPWTVPQ